MDYFIERSDDDGPPQLKTCVNILLARIPTAVTTGANSEQAIHLHLRMHHRPLFANLVAKTDSDFTPLWALALLVLPTAFAAPNEPNLTGKAKLPDRTPVKEYNPASQTPQDKC